MGKIKGHSLIKEVSGSIGKDLYVRKSGRNTICFQQRYLYGAMPAKISRLAGRVLRKLPSMRMEL